MQHNIVDLTGITDDSSSHWSELEDISDNNTDASDDQIDDESVPLFLRDLLF